MEDLLEEYQGVPPEARRELQARFPGERIELTHYLDGALTTREMDSTVERSATGLLEFEARVALLSPGDTLVFGDRSFRLGRFLGAGNTTHVWELADQPGAVIRIPFLAGEGFRTQMLAPVLPVIGSRARLHRMREMLSYVVRGQERSGGRLPIPRVIETSITNGYAVVERIAVRENGQDWFTRNARVLNEWQLRSPQTSGPRFAAEVARVAQALGMPPDRVAEVGRLYTEFLDIRGRAGQLGFHDLEEYNWALDQNGRWVILDYTVGPRP